MQKLTDKKRALKILEILGEEYPQATPALQSETPFQLLIATILSAQCTDDRVNEVTEKLFRKYTKPEDYLKVPNEILEKDIFSTGYYKQKARNIKACCDKLITDYNGEVPADFDELVKLPGVGRKTASVVAGNAFGVPSIAVDTHVIRLSNILGFINSRNQGKIEARLKELFPEEWWVESSHWLQKHGRNTCIARRPKCLECRISDYCPGYNTANFKEKNKGSNK
jgi:endonuclease-3